MVVCVGYRCCSCARADASRDQAAAEGFTPGDVHDASAADVVCILVPDDAAQVAEDPVSMSGEQDVGVNHEGTLPVKDTSGWESSRAC